MKLVERGELEAADFMSEISAMTADLVKTYEAIKGANVLFPSEKESVGKCPRCGGAVIEKKNGFFCENRSCNFGIWKDNKFFSSKGKVVTKQNVSALLKDGRVRVTGLRSPKTGFNYDATVVLEDSGDKYVNFRLEFDKK